MSSGNLRIEPADVKPGLRWFCTYGHVRVMAVADNWAMVRRPRGIPFVMSVSEIVEAVNPKRSGVAEAMQEVGQNGNGFY